MEKTTQNITIMLNALKTLDESIQLFHKHQRLTRNTTHKDKQLLSAMRDSMICRFKYCMSLFYTTTKEYLDSQGVDVFYFSPQDTFQEAVKIQLLSESENNNCMKMIESRHEIPNCHHEPIAEKIALDIPEYYKLMTSITERLKTF